MSRRLVVFILLLALCHLLMAQGVATDYRRSSLTTMLVYHPEDEFGINIYCAFDSIPMPDKYDEHNVGVRVINDSLITGVRPGKVGLYKAKYGHVLSASEIKANALHLEHMLNQAQIGRAMVARWFNLQGDSVSNATFNTSLIQQRGQYNASDVDVAVAMQTVRGVSALSDAGEELIGQTYVLVNDITYVTAEEEAKAAKISMQVIGGLFDAFAGGNVGSKLANTTGAIADSFTGFNVKTHSYLFQLIWNDSIANHFYRNHYTAVPNREKIEAFLNDTNSFRIRYVAHEYEYDKKSVLKGKYERSELVKTICARSMDKNIVALGKQYEDFKVKTPVFSVLEDKGRIVGYAAKIGLKEGIQESSKFQVVQRVYHADTQSTTYKYIATVQPVKKMIWDNRYNAVLEQAEGAELNYTTFRKVAGGEILPGMLLVEGKFSKVEQAK